MSNIHIDDMIMGSPFPGFSYTGVLTGSLLISGSVPNTSGRSYSTTFTVPSDSFIIGYYVNPDSTGYAPNRMYRIGNLPNASIDGVGNNTYIFGSLSGTTYTVRVHIDNFTGASQTVPTQDIDITVYLFKSPFN